MASVMKEFEASSNLFGSNAPYVEELYESYLTDPASVDESWRAVLSDLKRRLLNRSDLPATVAAVHQQLLQDSAEAQRLSALPHPRVNQPSQTAAA